MKDIFKINLIAIPKRNLSLTPLERLQKTWLYQLYLHYFKPIPFIRWYLFRLWCLLYPVYAGVKTYLTSSDPAKAWRPLIKMQDFVATNQRPSKQIFAPVRVETPTPFVAPIKDRELLKSSEDHYVFPAVYVTELGTAMVYGGSNLVFTDEAVICHDLYNFESDYTSEEVHGRHLIDPKAKHIRLLHPDPTPTEIDCAASFADACAENYAHWMTEVLPRIALFCNVSEYEEVPIIINDDLHPNILHSLYLMVGEKRKVILLPVGCAIKLDKLIQVSVTGYVPFGRRDRKFKNHGNGVFNPLALKNMRDKIIAKCNNKKTNARIEKIYFQRKSAHRNVQNIQELEGILEKNGYSFLDPSALSFINQVNLLRNANNVIASTGAAMCNAIFCNENSKIIVLMGKHEDMIYRYWANMLQPIGMNVIYILGEQSNASETSIHGNFQINMEWFRWVIND